MQVVSFCQTHNNAGLVDVRGDAVNPRDGYKSLASQLSAVQPTPTQLNLFTPSNTPLAVCENFTSWEVTDVAKNVTVKVPVATTLPSAPNARLCSCRMSTLACTTDLSQEAAASTPKLTFCVGDPKTCYTGTSFNSSTGVYNAFAACNQTEQQSWIYNQYFLAHDKEAAACSAVGGVMKIPVQPKALDNDCRVMLQQAGPNGTGTVTFTSTAEVKEVIPGNRQPSQGGLSRGAQIGIGVGVSLGIAALVGILAILLRTRRKRRETVGAELEDSSKATEAGKQEQLDSNEVSELEGKTPTEMDGSAKRHELSPDTERQVHELSPEAERYEFPGENQLYELEARPAKDIKK